MSAPSANSFFLVSTNWATSSPAMTVRLARGSQGQQANRSTNVHTTNAGLGKGYSDVRPRYPGQTPLLSRKAGGQMRAYAYLFCKTCPVVLDGGATPAVSRCRDQQRMLLLLSTSPASTSRSRLCRHAPKGRCQHLPSVPSGRTCPHPKPAVAGEFDRGPASGAEFSDGPDSGATICPVG